jgi:hypothetical protein
MPSNSPCPSKDLFLRKLGFPRAKGQKSNLKIAAYCLLFSPPMEVSASLQRLYLSFWYRFRPLPNDLPELEKLAKNLQIPLALIYRAKGIDPELAKLRIREKRALYE